MLVVDTVISLLNYKFIKLQPFIRFVDVSATTAAFIRMTVHRQSTNARPFCFFSESVSI